MLDKLKKNSIEPILYRNDSLMVSSDTPRKIHLLGLLIADHSGPFTQQELN